MPGRAYSDLAEDTLRNRFLVQVDRAEVKGEPVSEMIIRERTGGRGGPVRGCFILKIVSEGRQLALILGCCCPACPIMRAARSIRPVARMFDRYQKTTADKGAQMLFID